MKKIFNIIFNYRGGLNIPLKGYLDLRDSFTIGSKLQSEGPTVESDITAYGINFIGGRAAVGLQCAGHIIDQVKRMRGRKE